MYSSIHPSIRLAGGWMDVYILLGLYSINSEYKEYKQCRLEWSPAEFWCHFFQGWEVSYRSSVWVHCSLQLFTYLFLIAFSILLLNSGQTKMFVNVNSWREVVLWLLPNLYSISLGPNLCFSVLWRAVRNCNAESLLGRVTQCLCCHLLCCWWLHTLKKQLI